MSCTSLPKIGIWDFVEETFYSLIPVLFLSALCFLAASPSSDVRMQSRCYVYYHGLSFFSRGFSLQDATLCIAALLPVVLVSLLEGCIKGHATCFSALERKLGGGHSRFQAVPSLFFTGQACPAEGATEERRGCKGSWVRLECLFLSALGASNCDVADRAKFLEM